MRPRSVDWIDAAMHLAAWLCCCVVIAVAMLAINSSLYTVAAHQATTTGRIVRLDLPNHGSFRYDYAIGDARYHGVGLASQIGNDVPVAGLSVVISYNIRSPAQSVVGDARERFQRGLQDAQLGALIFGSLIYLSIPCPALLRLQRRI